MNILVTGGTGFLGQKLVDRLLGLKHNVTVLGRNKSIGKQLKSKGVNFIPISLENTTDVINACEGQDYIIHCAALSSPWGKYEDFYNSNVLSTINLIEGAKKHNIKRFVHVSTPSIYFDFTDRVNISEKEPLPKKMVNLYAETKLMAEQALDKSFKEDGLPFIAIRPRALFGPNDNTIFPRLIRANAKGGVPIIGGGRCLADVTYVENVVDALILCMESKDNTLGKKYNITNGEPQELIVLIKMLFDKLGQPMKEKHIPFQLAYNLAGTMEFLSKHLLNNKEPVLTRYSVGVFSKDMTLDISAARKELGYEPRIDIQTGLEYFVDWWIKERGVE